MYMNRSTILGSLDYVLVDVVMKLKLEKRNVGMIVNTVISGVCRRLATTFLLWSGGDKRISTERFIPSTACMLPEKLGHFPPFPLPLPLLPFLLLLLLLLLLLPSHDGMGSFSLVGGGRLWSQSILSFRYLSQLLVPELAIVSTPYLKTAIFPAPDGDIPSPR